MGIVFLTGYPGFLGGELLPRILTNIQETKAVCLVQSRYAELARNRVRDLEGAHSFCQGRIAILEGDITRDGLGLASLVPLSREITEIYHLAAIYDLGVTRKAGLLVNVEGTRHMLEFAETCPHLERFHYVSTCYVSGTHRGAFSEDDLDVGQGFHNFYEETKFLAEVEVQRRMHRGLPATIYRPVIVVGDSTTGATQKYDGPYSVIRLLLRQPPALAVFPIVGKPDEVEVNLVPSDFVVRALAYLSSRPESKNRVYHLADPNPLTVGQMMTELARATGRRLIRIRMPFRLSKFALGVPGMARLIGIPVDTLDYFVHPARYGTANAQADLQGSGISCPRFTEYAGRLVKFVVAHPEVGSAAMA